MAIKQTTHSFRGMRKDVSPSKASSDYVVDAMNVRFTPNGRDSLFSITCERYPELKYTIDIESLGILPTSEKHTFNESLSNLKVLSSIEISNKIIIFIKGTNYYDRPANSDCQDFSYDYNIILSIRVDNEINPNSAEILFSGYTLSTDNLVDPNGNIYPMEYNYLGLGDTVDSLASYEAEDIQKVYWVDGVNQPRVINVAAPKNIKREWTNKSFDFIQELQLQETLEVEKIYQNGQFAPGVIQYCYTYFNKNGGETNIVDVSPILYISDRYKGNSPEDIVSNNCFNIKISNIDTTFDFIRIYSIHRTSLNAVANVKTVKDIELNSDSKEIQYLDTGIFGYNIDPTELLYKGGEYIIPKTLAQKDGTLFLGNIKLQNNNKQLNTIINTHFPEDIRNTNIHWKRNLLNIKGDDYNQYPKIYLDNNTASFRTFKYLETYRIGIQCQTATGKWLDPIFLLDKQVDISPNYESVEEDATINHNIYVVNGNISIPTSLINNLISRGIKRVRPVIVYPSESNKEILIQGVLNPTVFNTKQKYLNQYDSQCSWIFRPQAYYNKELFSYPDVSIKNLNGEVYYSGYGKTLTLMNSVHTDYQHNYEPSYGGWPESKNNVLLPPNYSILAELPHMQYTFAIYENTVGIDNDQSILGKYSGYSYGTDKTPLLGHDVDYYAVNKNIITLHSPELENEKVSDTDNFKLRIVGTVLFNRCNKDYDVEISNSNIKVEKENVNSIQKKSKAYLQGYNLRNNTDGKDPKLAHPSKLKFSTYLFSSKDIIHSSIVKQRVSNSFISNGTFFFKNKKYLPQETSDIKIFNTVNNDVVLKSSNKAEWHSVKRNFLYKGNVNDPLTAFKTEKFKFIFNSLGTDDSNFSDDVFWNNVLANGSLSYLHTGKYENNNNTTTKSYIYTEFKKAEGGIGSSFRLPLDAYTSNGVINVKYKSTPHAVIVLDHSPKENTEASTKLLLPSIDDSNIYIEEITPKYDWDGTYCRYKGVNINKENYLEEEVWDKVVGGDRYLWLAELYREVPNKFGDSDSENNLWYPAGKSVNLIKGSQLDLCLDYGDTFFSRYDCLKTYRYDDASVFNVVDTASFFVETRINTDLRWDNNRENVSNLTVSPQNFNKFNDVYNQIDNFFNYRTVSEDIARNTSFPHTITWTKQKISGDKIDVWTNITMASTLDLDGKDGELVKLYNFNNEIFSFQPKGISHILFNSREQINVSDGVPIEIVNGYRVSGSRKMSSIGSSHIKCINDNVSNIYFTDHLTKGIYRFTGAQVESISDKLNFSSWADKNIDINSYVYSDHSNKNIYIHNKNRMLCYSELLGEFESFFSYDNDILKSNGKSFILKNKDSKISLYELYSNITNSEYTLGDSYISLISNNSSTTNKCFTNIEFRADDMGFNYPNNENSEESNNSINRPFKYINVEDSHLKYDKDVELTYSKYKPSNLKKKFNTWRIEIPRIGNTRFFNPWVKIKLTFDRSNNPLGYEIHDLNVTFIE